MKNRRIRESLDKVKAAQAKFQAEVLNLYRGQSKIYSDEEHERRLAAIFEPFKSAVADAGALIDEVVTESERRITALSNSDPLDQLTPEQLVAAAALREFVADDAKSMSPIQLAARLEAVLLSDDPARRAVWSREIKKRVSAEAAKGQLTDPVQRLQRILHDSGGGSEVQEIRDELRAIQTARREELHPIAAQFVAREYGVDSITGTVAPPTSSAVQ